MILRRKIGNVKSLHIFYEGSGDPKDTHTILGISFIQGDKGILDDFQMEGQLDKMSNWDKDI